MTLRLAAGLALLLGLAAVLGYLQLVGIAPGETPESRHLRAMKNRTSAPDSVAAWTMADFEKLPHRWPLADYAPLERRAVSLEGWVQRMIGASDGDVHLEVACAPRLPDGPDTLYVTAEITPAWRRGSRTWRWEPLLAQFRPNWGGATPWDWGPRRARVSGWLLYDWQYDGVPSGMLRERASRVTGWEIHPVTRIELWDEARGGYVEWPR